MAEWRLDEAQAYDKLRTVAVSASLNPRIGQFFRTSPLLPRDVLTGSMWAHPFWHRLTSRMIARMPIVIIRDGLNVS